MLYIYFPIQCTHNGRLLRPRIDKRNLLRSALLITRFRIENKTVELVFVYLPDGALTLTVNPTQPKNLFG